MKTLVIDDHALIREAMRGVLAEVFPGSEMLEANTKERGRQLLASRSGIGLVLLDVNLPDGNGFELLVEIRERHPYVPVAMLSALNDRDTVMRCLQSGAVGFVPKTASRDVLVGALRLIAAGSVYVPPDILAEPKPQPTKAAADSQRPRIVPGELGLTERQIEVLALMMKGKSNKLICRALDLAEPTVKNHVSAILKALGTTNRTEAVLAAASYGWSFPEET